MEMDIKADKASLDSKVNISTFDNTFSMLDEGLREALQKMDDYIVEFYNSLEYQKGEEHILKTMSLREFLSR